MFVLTIANKIRKIYFFITFPPKVHSYRIESIGLPDAARNTLQDTVTRANKRAVPEASRKVSIPAFVW